MMHVITGGLEALIAEHIDDGSTEALFTSENP